jgi:hypothetical protein
LAEAKRKGHMIGFDVLYYAENSRWTDWLAEIGEKEGEYIRKYAPILNTQIPKEEDWHKFDVNTLDVKSILNQII